MASRVRNDLANAKYVPNLLELYIRASVPRSIILPSVRLEQNYAYIVISGLSLLRFYLD